MTVPSAAAERNDYIGAGSTATYAYSYRITAQTHLLVTVADLDGVETTLTISTDYTVTGVGVKTGGNIVLVDNNQEWLDGSGYLKTGYALTIRHYVPLVQNTDVRNQGVYYPEVHEDAFDYLMWAIKQQQDELDRCLKVGETSNTTVVLPVPQDGYALVWDGTDGNMTNGPVDIGAITAAVEAAQAAQAAAESVVVSLAIKADQAEAEAATADDKWMSPLQVKNQVQKAGAVAVPLGNIPYKDEDNMVSDSAVHVPTQQSVKAYVDAVSTVVTGKFNTSTGHDHDGTDSKKVLATNLDLTGISSGDYLYNNAGTIAGGSAVARSAMYATAGAANWTAPAGVTCVFVTMVGGGGGGAGGTGSGTSGGGGGAGAYVLRAALKVTAGNSYTVTVGAKGDKGTAGSGSNGGNSSVVGDHFTLTCNGGGGGAIPTAGSGGTSSGSFTGLSATASIGTGMAGGVLATSAGANGGAGSTGSAGGGGGAGSPFGKGGNGGDSGGAYAGASAEGFGSGGGGGWGAGGGYVGGDGAPGLVYLEW